MKRIIFFISIIKGTLLEDVVYKCLLKLSGGSLYLDYLWQGNKNPLYTNNSRQRFMRYLIILIISLFIIIQFLRYIKVSNIGDYGLIY